MKSEKAHLPIFSYSIVPLFLHFLPSYKQKLFVRSFINISLIKSAPFDFTSKYKIINGSLEGVEYYFWKINFTFLCQWKWLKKNKSSYSFHENLFWKKVKPDLTKDLKIRIQLGALQSKPIGLNNLKINENSRKKLKAKLFRINLRLLI